MQSIQVHASYKLQNEIKCQNIKNSFFFENLKDILTLIKLQEPDSNLSVYFDSEQVKH